MIKSSSQQTNQIAIHVTHEAAEKIAGIGAVIGGIGGLIAGKRAKKRAEQAYQEAMQEVDDTTMDFNRANMAAGQRGLGRDILETKMSRERNPYMLGYSSPFMV